MSLKWFTWEFYLVDLFALNSDFPFAFFFLNSLTYYEAFFFVDFYI